MKKIVNFLLIVLVGVFLTACKNSKLEEIHVVATAVPHEQILIEAIPLLEELGYKLKITVISDYSLGNPAVANGSADVNYFQHLPYLNQYNVTAAANKQLVNVAGIHIEPIGLYSGSRNSVEDLKDGDTILISDNAPDYGRIVNFLANIGLVTVADDFDPEDAISSPEDAILSKTVNFKFQIIEAALLVAARKNKEGALFFINGNYALQGGLGLQDVLVSEPTENNPYVNVLAVLKGRENDPKIKALVEVLTSEHIQAFIRNKYKGSVIPA